MYGVAGLLLNSDRCEVKNQSDKADGPWLKDKQDKSDHNGDNLTMPTKSDTRKLYTSTIYKSAEREAVLELCDYYDPIYKSKNSKNGDGVEDRIQALLDNDETTRAAAYGKQSKSITFLYIIF